MTQERASSHIVGSLYNFSEAAGHKIVCCFKKKYPDTSCQFNDGQYFTIDVPHNDDKSLAHLANSISDFILGEKNKEPDMFDEKKITRKDKTHPSLTRAAVTEAALTDKRMQVNNSNHEEPLIEHENIIRKWSPSSESRELGSKSSLQLLGRIGDICGCRIEQASDSAHLWIKADTERGIERGVSKLERLNKMMIDEMSFPRIKCFYVSEGEMSISLRLIALKDLVDKRSVTTLIRKDPLNKSLRELCVLVLVKGSNVIQVKLKPAATDRGSQLWNDHMYDCGQAQDRITVKTAKEPETQVRKWVSEVADPDVQMDVFRPESTVEVQQSDDVEMKYQEPLSPITIQTTKRARTTRGNPNAIDKTSLESQNEYDNKKPKAQENMKNFKGYQPTKNMSTSKESESHRQPPSIEPPYMPPLIMPSCSCPKTPSITPHPPMPSSPKWSVVNRNSKSGSLIDASCPNEGRVRDNKLEEEVVMVIDNLQDTSIVNARDLRYTMNQRKAPTQAFVKGNDALVKSFEESANYLLALALPRTGRIEFVVDVGRLLINQQCGSSELKNRSFKTSEFPSVLLKGRTTGFEPLFTNMLTARSSDAESIVNILLSQGRRLFQEQPTSRKVTYLFSCKTKGVDQVVLELDENGDFNMQGSGILVGALDWHFPKRAWDARLRLTSERFLATDYQRQVKGIIDNFKIGVSGDGQSLELWTKTIDDNLSIESIELRRETLHPVTIYPDLILHLTECQDLQVRQSSGPESIYRGSIQPPKVMVKSNRLWWEAKISSINATNILKENVALELGETATWTPSSIVNKGVVRDLFAAVQETVTRIDHVGFFNRGKDSVGSKTTEKLSENTQDVPTSLRRVDPAFW